MDFAQYVKIIMLILMFVAVSSALIKRGIMAKVLYVIAFLAQIVITFWAIASYVEICFYLYFEIFYIHKKNYAFHHL